jgi:hypothetical protein
MLCNRYGKVPNSHQGKEVARDKVMSEIGLFAH